MKKSISKSITPADNSETGMYSYRYPHPALTTDCCIFTFFDGELYILLVQRGIEPYKGVWALPGGFVRIDETAEQCARRELFEETGYEAERIVQFHTYSAVDRDPRERVVTVAFYALVKWGRVHGGDDADRAAWCPLSALPKLAFDHADIVADALKVMKRDMYFEPLGYELLPPEFSMSELQRVYEKIMNTKFDRRNFYNKMRNTKMVIEVENEDELKSEDCLIERLCSLEANMSSVMPSYCSSSMPEEDYCLLCEEPDREAHSTPHASKSSRRSNVKYRFNIEKFTDIFKNSDEPFKP